MEFQQSELIAERRRWILVLVNSSDGVTGLTGQTGTVFISKNGATGVASTNSIVEIDSSNMPGHYYIELTSGEVNTLGMISITKKTASSLAFHDRAIVSYNDPFKSAGGFNSGTTTGGGGGGGITLKQLRLIAEQVWQFKMPNGTAQENLVQAAQDQDIQFPETKFPEIPTTDLQPVLTAIANIKIPQAKDYTTALESLANMIKNFENASVDGIKQATAQFTGKMDLAAKDINSSLATVADIKQGYETLKGLVEQFNSKMAEMSDMDKRFENMTSVMQRQQLDKLVLQINASMKKILIAITNQSYSQKFDNLLRR